ncbi:MAG: SGNH/GDSL hydrolase family protein [Opitutaceae bacterium]
MRTATRLSLPGLLTVGFMMSLHASDMCSPLLRLTGDWQIEVRVPQGDQATPMVCVVEVPPAAMIEVTGERYAALPLFDPAAGGWAMGAALRGVRAQECTTKHLLDPESFVLKAGSDPESMVFEDGLDYAIDREWGTFGRLEGGRIAPNQPVHASYRHGLLRLDSIIRLPDGNIALRPGEARSSNPRAPALAAGETRLANLWLPGRIQRLDPDHLFPISESSFPEPPPSSPTTAEKYLPKTLAKLQAGGDIRILAWGDSVTDAGYLGHPETERWQVQFVDRLRRIYPRARISLTSAAWGGRTTVSFLEEPPGSEHNYQETVLAVRPDLVVSEFVNDAGLDPAGLDERYGRILDDFRGIGAEWIILTPHYVRPDWMDLTKETGIDDDPRPYVKALRTFAAGNNVALADASLRYGRLWRQGLPVTSLMMNSINHPDERGMRIFADSLIALFGAE